MKLHASTRIRLLPVATARCWTLRDTLGELREQLGERLVTADERGEPEGCMCHLRALANVRGDKLLLAASGSAVAGHQTTALPRTSDKELLLLQLRRAKAAAATSSCAEA